MKRLAFIGFGEAARAFVASLRQASADVRVGAFDILTSQGRDEALRAAATGLDVTVFANPSAAVRDANWVFSAVTAADSLDAAASVAAALGSHQVFIDINSVSAGRKTETARLLAPSGCAYVDMAVMAPVHPRGHATPSLLAGPAAKTMQAEMAALGFAVDVVGDEIGAATSIKMLRSLFVKGMEAVTVQTLLAARAAGRFDEVYASLAGSFGRLGWPDFPLYQLERVVTHGIRRAAEMRESAATQAELGFDAGAALAHAIADVQQAVGSLGITTRGIEDPADAYRRVLDAIAGPAPSTARTSA